MTIASGTLVSLLFTAAKSIVMASYFGTGAGLDSYFMALIPMMVISGILVSSMQTSLIMVYVDYLVAGRKVEADRLFLSFLAIIFTVFVFICLAFYVFSRETIQLIAPGFDDERIALSAKLLRIVVPTILICSLSDILAGYFHGNRRFAIPVIGGVANVFVSLVYLVLFKDQGVFALAVGSLIGSLVQLLWAGGGVYAAGLALHFRVNFQDPGLKLIVRNTLPLMFVTIFSGVNIIVDQIMASALPAGSVSALNYANNMNSALTQLFVFSVGSAILPFFSHQYSAGKIEELKSTLRMAVRMGIFILVPITLMILFVGTPIVKVFYERGAFGNASTTAVSGALKAFALGLTAYGIVISLVRALTSVQDMKYVAYVSLASIGANVSLNFILMKSMAHVGIALSTSITYFLTAVVLGVRLVKKVGKFGAASVADPALKIVFNSLVSSISSLYLLRVLNVESAANVAISVSLGLAVYVAMSWLTRIKEMATLFDSIRMSVQ